MNTFIILFKAKGCILRWTGRAYILAESNMKCFLVSCLWKRERWPEESLKSLAISVYCSSSCSCTKGSMISCLQTWNIIYIIFGLFFFSPASEMFVKEQITSIYSLLLMIMKARFLFLFFSDSILTALLFEFPWTSSLYSPEKGLFWGRFSMGSQGFSS